MDWGWHKNQIRWRLLGVTGAVVSLMACQPVSKPSSPTASQTASTPTAVASPSPSSPTAVNPNSDNALTLYTTIDPTLIEPLLHDFSQRSGVRVQTVFEPAKALLARLTTEGKQSPADIILTKDVGIFQQAVDASLLQAFNSDKALQGVPSRFKDPNANWLALTYYARTAVYDSRVVNANDLASYASLAKPTWFQKLCLSQAEHTPNQAFVTNLMNNLGDKKTQETLQGWVANLAMPVTATDSELLPAIDMAKCQVALVNSDDYALYLQQHPQTAVRLTWLNTGYGGTHINITGVAIPRSAKHPELALNFIEWLSEPSQQSLFASLTKTFPVNPTVETTGLLKSWGELETSPMPISQYADKHKIALDTMKDAGWQ